MVEMGRTGRDKSNQNSIHHIALSNTLYIPSNSDLVTLLQCDERDLAKSQGELDKQRIKARLKGRLEAEKEKLKAEIQSKLQEQKVNAQYNHEENMEVINV